MNIIVICPLTTGLYKDDTQMFCDGLEKYCGHKVTRLTIWEEKGKYFSNHEITPNMFKDIDVVWAPYEPLIPFVIGIKRDYNIPAVGHFEILPPGKILLDMYEHYWFYHTEEIKPDNVRFKYILDYKTYANLFLECDVKSVTGPEIIYGIERLLGKKIRTDELYIKPYPMDTEYLDTFRLENPIEKNQILFLDRMSEYKRVLHVLEAFRLLKNPPKLIMAGKGHLEDVAKEFAKKHNLNIEVKGRVTDAEKVKLIQESMFLVEPISVLTPCEGAYFKKPSICYDECVLRERMNEMVTYTNCNDIPMLAKTIQYFIDNPKERKELGEKAHYLLMNDMTHTHTLEVATKFLNQMFIEAIK